MRPKAPALIRRDELAPLPLAVAVAAHAVLLALLLAAPEAAETVTPPRPLMLSLIAAPPPEPLAPPDAQQARAPAKPEIDPPPTQRLVAERAAAEPQPPAEVPPPEAVAAPEPAAPAEPAPAPVAAPLAAIAPAASAAVDPPQPEPPPTPPRAAAYLSNPKPAYPALSRRLGEEGVVRLNILVNPDGSVARLELANSSGFPRLDRSAMETVQSSWKFEPARRGGKAVAAWVIVPIQFNLRS
jgi:protein TonB